VGFAGLLISSSLLSWGDPCADIFSVAMGIRFRRDITQEGGQEWNRVDAKGALTKYGEHGTGGIRRHPKPTEIMPLFIYCLKTLKSQSMCIRLS